MLNPFNLLGSCFPFRNPLNRSEQRQNIAPRANGQAAAAAGDQVSFNAAPLSPEEQYRRQYELNQRLLNAIQHMDEVGVKAVQGAIRRGAQVQGPRYSSSPLHVAARYGRPEAIDALVANGADIDLVNDDGETPLYWAVHYGKTGSIKALLAHGADPALLPEELKQGQTNLLEQSYKKLHVDKLIQKEKTRLHLQELTPQQLNALKKQVSRALEIIQTLKQAGIQLDDNALIPFKKQFDRALAYTNWQLNTPNLTRMEKVGQIARIRPILRSGVPLKDNQVTLLAEHAQNVNYMEALVDAIEAAEDYTLIWVAIAQSYPMPAATSPPANNVTTENILEDQ